MKHTLVRITIAVPEAFIALSAIAGGIVLLAGTYKDGVLIEAGGRGQFPLEWLQHTPFSDYTIPALVLGILLLPITTLVYVLVYSLSGNGVTGWGWLWVVLAVLVDLAAHSYPARSALQARKSSIDMPSRPESV